MSDDYGREPFQDTEDDARDLHTDERGRPYTTPRYRERPTYLFPTPGRVTDRDRRVHPLSGLAVVLILLGLAFGAFLTYHYQYGTETNLTVKVTRLDDQSQGRNGHRYLVFGTLPSGEVIVLQDTDSFFHGKFNSSDLFAQLQVGKTYDFHVYGTRNRLTSSYQVILSFTPSNGDQG